MHARIRNQGIPMITPTTQQQKHLQPQDEHILVVKRNHLFPDAAWQGLQQVDFTNWLNIIQERKEFLPRSIMETDSTYKQIIPYLVFEHQDSYFLMQRQAQASEKRLASKYSLGIGGHIRQEDLGSSNIFDWAQREFHEEVDYKGDLAIEPLGILNDDSNDVGKVHLGFVFLLKGDSAQIRVKSELKSGQLLSLEQCKQYAKQMETWSQLVFEFLLK